MVDVTVRGAGIFGLSIAWVCAQGDHIVLQVRIDGPRDPGNLVRVFFEHHQIDGYVAAPAKRSQTFETAHVGTEEITTLVAFELVDQERFTVEANVEHRPTVGQKVDPVERDRRKRMEMPEQIH